MKALAQARSGRMYTVKWNTCSGNEARLTERMGLYQGNDLFLVNRFFADCIVRVNGSRLAVCGQIAERIKV